MYYKVLKNDAVIDVLDSLVYVKWQKKYDVMVLATERDAQGILQSDQTTIWHVRGLPKIQSPGYDTVELRAIDEQEYKQRKMLLGKTPEEIIDAFVLSLLDSNII